MISFCKFISPLLAIALLSACGTPETLVFESGPVTLTAEGPLFEGSNTAQGTWAPGLDEFLQAHGAALDQVRAAKVVAAHLDAFEGGNLNGIRSASLSVASEAGDMEQVAVLNPVPPDQQRVTLTTATGQKALAAHLKQTSVTVVADLDLDADSEDDRHVIGTFTIELQLAR
ncbi:MAG: hypothetical protein JNM31_06020 [Flavobacteriales bacterium]|nr:hypothetical protein [Flavobacteriales bacterium]